MKTNNKTKSAPVYTHNGAIAKRVENIETLRRTIMTCMLWEDCFYENGVSIVDRIKDLVSKTDETEVAKLAIEARTKQKLRHVPLMIVREMARNKMAGVRKTLAEVIQRPDEITEFMSLYWKEGRCPIAKQVKLGLADAFAKFNEYSLAKYNQDKDIKLRDVMFLVHAKPSDSKGRSKRVDAVVKKGVKIRGEVKRHKNTLFEKLATDTLAVPDTWETALSAGNDKYETWTRLLEEKKLGALALLRNIRNMCEANVSKVEIKKAISEMNAEKILPFRFINAAKYAPWMEDVLEAKMIESLSVSEKLRGSTVLLVDVSGSMEDPISSKSDLRRMDAANGLAILLREVCENIRIFTFSNHNVEVPNRRGFALRSAIESSQSHGGTRLGNAVESAKALKPDRLIVISDEQSSDPVSNSGLPLKSYMLNVGTCQNGVAYGRTWTNISGWSEEVINFITCLESNR